MRNLLITFLIIILIIGGGILSFWALQDQFFAPSPPAGLPGVSVNQLPQTSLPPPDSHPSPFQPPVSVEVVAQDLSVPWALAWLPDGQLLVTERTGQLLMVRPAEKTIPISGVKHVGEGGLLGLVVHPNFSVNHYLYLYLTTQTDEGLTNRIERYQLHDTQLSDRTIIFDNIPGANYHDGGRLAFGPDGYLYATTGDAGTDSNAQNPDSLAGKILRLSDDGTIPPDNPFGSAVYSLGHRNPQGLTWDDQGSLWSTEHGRSGLKSGLDELNLIQYGENYGWPTIQGDATQDGLITPQLNSGPDITWAPASAVYYNHSIFFGGLRGQTLYQVTLNTNHRPDQLISHFYQEFGRIRDVAVGPDGWLYFTTSNTDGRGDPQDHDDKIIRLNPELLE